MSSLAQSPAASGGLPPAPMRAGSAQPRHLRPLATAMAMTPSNPSAGRYASPSEVRRPASAFAASGARGPTDRALLAGLNEVAQRAAVERQQRRQLHYLAGMSLSYVSSPNSTAAIAKRPATAAGVLGLRPGTGGSTAAAAGRSRVYGSGESATPGNTYLPLHQYGDGIDVFSPPDGQSFTTASDYRRFGATAALAGHRGATEWDARNPDAGGAGWDGQPLPIAADDAMSPSSRLSEAARLDSEAARVYTRDGINHSKGAAHQKTADAERAAARAARVVQLLREGGASEDDIAAAEGERLALLEAAEADAVDTTAANSSAILEDAAARRGRPESAMIPLYPSHFSTHSNRPSSPNYGVTEGSPSYQRPPHDSRSLYAHNGSGAYANNDNNNSITNTSAGVGGGLRFASSSFYPNQHEGILLAASGAGLGGASPASPSRRPGSAPASSSMHHGYGGANNSFGGGSPLAASRSRPATAANHSAVTTNTIRDRQLISAHAIAPFPSRSGRPVNGDFLIAALEKDPNNAVAWDCLGALMAEGRLRTRRMAEWLAIAEAKREEAKRREEALIAEMEGARAAKDAAEKASKVEAPSVAEIAKSKENPNISAKDGKIRAWRVTQVRQQQRDEANAEDLALREERRALVRLTPAQRDLYYNAQDAMGRVRTLLAEDISSGSVIRSSGLLLEEKQQKEGGAEEGATAAGEAPLCDCEDNEARGGLGCVHSSLGEPAMFCYVNGERYTPTACFAAALERDDRLGAAWGHLAMWLIRKQREPTLLMVLAGAVLSGVGAGSSSAYPPHQNNASSVIPPYSYPFGQRAADMLADDRVIEDRYYAATDVDGAPLYPCPEDRPSGIGAGLGGVGFGGADPAGSGCGVDAEGNRVPFHSNYCHVFINGRPHTVRDCLVRALEGFDDTRTNAAAWNYLGVNLGNNEQSNRNSRGRGNRNGLGDDDDDDDLFSDGSDEDNDGDAIDGDGFGKGWPTDFGAALGTDVAGDGTNTVGAAPIAGGDADTIDGTGGDLEGEGGQQKLTSVDKKKGTAGGGKGPLARAAPKQPTTAVVSGREHNAKRCFQRALECDLTYPEAWVNLAMTLNPDGTNPRDCVVVGGRVYTQRQCMMKVLALHPNYGHAWNTLGFMLEPLVEVVAIVPDEEGALRLQQSAAGILSASGHSLRITSALLDGTAGPYGFDEEDGKKGQPSIVLRASEGASDRNPPIPPQRPLLATFYDPSRHGRYVPQVIVRAKEKMRGNAVGYASAARLEMAVA